MCFVAADQQDFTDNISCAGRGERRRGIADVDAVHPPVGLHTHTLKVAVLHPADVPGFGFEAFRDHVRRRLPLLEPLRYKLVDIPWRLHHPMWLERCNVHLDHHLTHSPNYAVSQGFLAKPQAAKTASSAE